MIRIPLLAHIRHSGRVGNTTAEILDILLLLYDLVCPDCYSDNDEVEKYTNSYLEETYSIVEEINHIHKIKVGTKLACSRKRN